MTETRGASNETSRRCHPSTSGPVATLSGARGPGAAPVCGSSAGTSATANLLGGGRAMPATAGCAAHLRPPAAR